MTAAAPISLEALRGGGKPGLARALAALEAREGTLRHADLLDAACAEPKGAVIGLTGPPGVGKSTLVGRLIESYRARGQSVAVLAVDPSSQVSRGAVLGDRTRFGHDPEDPGVFVRSAAAAGRLGGLSPAAIGATVLMRALFDRVLVETVGVGQSEADIGLVADTVVVCVQPGAGDALQFIKAGVMELPDVIAVMKADLGETAIRARHEVAGALRLASADAGSVEVVPVAALGGDVEALLVACERHFARERADGRLAAERAARARRWVEDAVAARFGSHGLACWRARSHSHRIDPHAPFAAIRDAVETLGRLFAAEPRSGPAR